MTINSAMQSGIAALMANATALANVSSNIANSNTTAYKTVNTNFTDMVGGTSSTNAATAGGVVSVSRQSITTQGELNSDTSGYSLAIDGQGFFVVSDSASAVSTNASTSSSSSLLFTRDGSFSTDTAGNLVNSGGYYLLGWAADSSGKISTSSTDASSLVPINVSDLANKPSATTDVSFTANLDASTTTSDAVTNSTYDPTTSASMSSYDATTSTGTKPDATIAATVSDSLGQSHTITVSLLKGATDTDTTSATYGETKWSYEVSSPDVTSDNGLNQITTGSLYFDSTGKLDTTNSTGGLVASTGLSIGASSDTSGVHWNTSIGAAAQSITMGLGTSGSSTITQLSGDTTTSSMTTNGTEFGSLSSVKVGSDGLVKATYSDGQTRTLAQVALATFVNANGLTAVSGNAYAVSTASGAYSLKVPGQSGAGTIDSDTLEASTVDLAQQFTSLITVQRAYSAASKVVTTADQMMQELLSIKQ